MKPENLLIRAATLLASCMPFTCVHAGSGPTFSRIVSDPLRCEGTQACYVSARCSGSDVVWGGGIIGDQVKTESSYPSLNNQWSVGFRGALTEYGDAAHATARAVAICGPRPAGYVQAFSNVVQCNAGDGHACVTGAQCPSGSSFLLSGGFLGTESQMELTLSQDNIWVADWYADTEDLGSGALGLGLSIAICSTAAPAGSVIVPGAGGQCHQDGPSCTATASCPIGTVLIGAGFNSAESEVESIAPTDSAALLVSWYPASSEFGGGFFSSGSPVAYCAAGQAADAIFAGSFDP